MKIIYMKCIFVKAASVLKTSEGMLTIVVCNPKEGALEAAAAKKAGGNDPKASKPEAKKKEPPADPATCEVKPGKETVLEINKDKLGLGLSIVGGSDTLLVNSRLTHFFFFLSKFRLKLRSTFISLTDSLYSSIKKKMFPGRYLDPRGLPGRRCRQRQEVEAGRPNPGRQRRELPQRHSQPSLDRSKTDTRQG